MSRKAPKVAILGAGLAGLTCAKTLVENGITDLTIFEAKQNIGGRVRHLRENGFTFDLGFQVLLDSYPMVKRHLNLDKLKPRYFDSGSVLVSNQKDRQVQALSNPLRAPLAFSEHLFSKVFTFKEKWRLVQMFCHALNRERLPAKQSTLTYLRNQKWSEEKLDRFFRPFFGGVFLDNALGAPAKQFLHYYLRFAQGRALVPAQGMGAIPAQLASHLPHDSIQLSCPVNEVCENANNKVQLSHTRGQQVYDRVVLAVDPSSSSKLLPSLTSSYQPRFRQTKVFYFESTKPLLNHRKLVLPHRPRAAQHYVQISNVAPEYCPKDKALLSATVLDHSPHFGNDEEKVGRIIAEEIATNHGLKAGKLHLKKCLHVAEALPSTVLSSEEAQASKIFISGDYTLEASINGAMLSGERAAQRLLDSIKQSSAL